ncbi:hypothetical protein Tco_0858024 [Tanacetum coccineum]|uniref:Uncharacterized protein n=1 Tax=Tanacetum coccineum TaxID=301880 RepID=A0ABQ5BA50_9ASTR
MELHVVFYGIECVARPLLLFFSYKNQLLWFRYREYDLAHLKLVFEFSIYKVWKSVGYGVSKCWIRRIILIPYLEYGVLSLFGYGVLIFIPEWSLTLFDVINALTSKSNSSTKPIEIHHRIDEFDLKDETSLSKYDEDEQNVLYFNDLSPFNIIYLDDLKSDNDNDDNEIDIIQSSGGNVNTQGSNKLLEARHDKINKIFIMESFVTKLDVNIMALNYLVNGMLLNPIKNLYLSFGIPLDPKRFYKDGV